MHEASLMRDLMRRIETLAAGDGAARVVGVRVRLGALSHISPAHFTEHFEEASRGGIAEGAALAIETDDDIAAPDAQTVRLESIEVE